ncbi:hypothetical protein AB4Z17_32175 [Paenibacillus sp. TAF43_2]|uniref:hypothetical protein n=1 Tax=Paenibacillus sp. TAF43_2 TaxID=3233069 RepID=UPI003F9B286E
MSEGDDVVVIGGHRTASYTITKVKKITPKGKIRTEYGDLMYDENGRVTGGSWNKTSLSPDTSEIREEIWRGNIIKKLSGTDFSTLSSEQLKEIYDIT